MTNDELIHKISNQVLSSISPVRLTLDDAKLIIQRGEEKAASISVPMVISIVDEGGNLIAMHRMDDALLASIAISRQKAYTALSLKTATSDIARSVLPGQPLYGLENTHPGDFCLFGGGIPVIRHGRCIGAVGVSGGTVEQDTLVACYSLNCK